MIVICAISGTTYNTEELKYETLYRMFFTAMLIPMSLSPVQACTAIKSLDWGVQCEASRNLSLQVSITTVSPHAIGCIDPVLRSNFWPSSIMGWFTITRPQMAYETGRPGSTPSPASCSLPLPASHNDQANKHSSHCQWQWTLSLLPRFGSLISSHFKSDQLFLFLPPHTNIIPKHITRNWLPYPSTNNFLLPSSIITSLGVTRELSYLSHIRAEDFHYISSWYHRNCPSTYLTQGTGPTLSEYHPSTITSSFTQYHPLRSQTRTFLPSLICRTQSLL